MSSNKKCIDFEKRKQKIDSLVQSIQTNLYYTTSDDPKREILLKSLKNARNEQDRLRKEVFQCYRDSWS